MSDGPTMKGILIMSAVSLIIYVITAPIKRAYDRKLDELYQPERIESEI